MHYNTAIAPRRPAAAWTNWELRAAALGVANGEPVVVDVGPAVVEPVETLPPAEEVQMGTFWVI